MSWLISVSLAALFLFLMMTVLWFIARRIDNYALVDVGWSYSFAAVMVIYLLLNGIDGQRSLVLGLLVVIWSLRLGTHLYLNRIRGKPEEGRYQTLRQKWHKNPARSFFIFYQAQAISVVFLATPFLLVVLDPQQKLGLLEFIALGIAVVSVVGESISDLQLQRFIARPDSKGKVCNVGLWRWSRHPNYFFESLIWLAFALFALPAPMGWLGLVSPLIIWYLIINVTGIPPTEAQCLKSRGDAYRAYQKQVSAFFPMPPKSMDKSPASI